MLPSHTQARQLPLAIQPASRRRAAAEPAEPSNASTAKRRREDPLSALQNISRLEDLSSELHSTVVAYLPPAETVAYIEALPARFRSMSEAASAESRLKTRSTTSFAALLASARGLYSIDRAFRAAAIHEILSLLKRLARQGPLQHAKGPMGALLATCRAASRGLAHWHVDRLEKEALQIELCVGMRQARNGDELHALVLQVPRLLAADQGDALLGAMRAIERLSRSRQAAPSSVVNLEQVLLTGLDLARTRSEAKRAPILHAAFHAYIESTQRVGTYRWNRARHRLAADAVALTPATFYQVVPSYDDQFIETVSDLMRPLPAKAGVAMFDTLLHFAPPAGLARLDALTNMVALLTKLPANAMSSRLAVISRQAAQIDPSLGYRNHVFEDLVTDDIFRALPAADVGATFDLLLDDIRASGLGRSAVARLHDDLEGLVGHAPAHRQAAMRERLLRERAEH